MRISVSAPGRDLDASNRQAIERDLEKLTRRLHEQDDAAITVRVTEGPPATVWRAVLEVDYRRTHLVASSEGPDIGQAVRAAREEILSAAGDLKGKKGNDLADILAPPEEKSVAWPEIKEDKKDWPGL